ncbi:GNAT family N-acetyltransferase [Aurantibacter crassamenti]|nr:GNAT family N-acetyltransferase [Aurantibacter crassamenti]MBM1108048.1 GNAT family N-acetyltransferase [Aurantibacter crassamenti]
MEEVLIRKATVADLPALLNFEQGVIAFERPFDPTLAEDPISYYDLREMIISEDAEVLVGEYLGELIASGYAQIKTAKAYLNFEKYAYLGFMFTAPESRGKGVNKKIIDGLKAWSIAKNLKEIRLTVYEENENAIKAYEKVGFKKHIIEMRLED